MVSGIYMARELCHIMVLVGRMIRWALFKAR